LQFAFAIVIAISGNQPKFQRGVEMNNILIFKKIIILRGKGLHFKVLFAKYSKSDYENNLYGKEFRNCGNSRKLSNSFGGEL
jgi:hypothetical protein